MSLRMRRGAIVPEGTGGGVPQTYGPENGPAWVRSSAACKSVSSPGGAIEFATMSALQTAINANPANSMFVATSSNYTISGSFSWTAGKHPRIYVPGAQTVVFNGGGGNNYIDCPAGGFEWYGGKFINVGNLSSPSWMGGHICRGDVILQDIEYASCYSGANYNVYFPSGQMVWRRLYVHDALYTGLRINGSGTESIQSPIVEYCRVDNCNAGRFDPGPGGAGTKFLHTTNGVWRYNWLDNNYGFGLWWDANESSIHAYDNVVENGLRAGIFYEISGGGTRIHNNALYSNGYGNATYPATDLNSWQIEVSNSDGTLGAGTGIEVDHNIVDGTGRNIGLVNHATHPMDCLSVNVHDNQVWMRGSSAKVGGWDQETTRLLWTETSNDFQDQQYHVASLSHSNWQWDSGTGYGSAKTFAQWQAYGFDTSATRTVI